MPDSGYDETYIIKLGGSLISSQGARNRLPSPVPDLHSQTSSDVSAALFHLRGRRAGGAPVSRCW